ncbi:MAG: hypothetical protein KFF73_18025, partial [Cyclobacteriaceae bacterium]|nr:hypothetical protein [Cyclobacteriaceae bacterium]
MTNFNNTPCVEVKEDFTVWKGWADICSQINQAISKAEKDNMIVIIETYQGVIDEELVAALQKGIGHDLWINSANAMKREEELLALVYPDVTDDRIFGYLTRLNMTDFMDQSALLEIRGTINQATGTIIIYGTGGSLIPDSYDLLIYADMARWEIQQRMRKNLV